MPSRQEPSGYLRTARCRGITTVISIAALPASPQLFVTFTQNVVFVVSAADVNVAESVPTGFDVMPDGPSYH